MNARTIFASLIKGIDRVNRGVGEILAYFLFFMFGLLMLEVFLRYLFNSPTVWANEVSQFLFGSYAILSGGCIFLGGGHVNVDIIYSHLSARKKAALDITTSVLFFLFAGMLLYFGSAMAFDSLTTLEHSRSAWNPPLYPFKLMIPLGALLIILQGLSKLLLDIFILFDLEPPVVHETHAGESL